MNSKGRKGNRSRADQNRIVRPNRQIQTPTSLGPSIHTKQGFDLPYYGYNNKYLTSVTQLLVGCPIQVQTTSGETFEGILQSTSPKLEIILRNAHLRSTVNEKRQEPCQVPNKNNLLDQLVLQFDNIVCIKCINVDLEYGKKDILQTDSMISGCNGPLIERELMPWQPDKNDSGLDDALETITDMSNGGLQYDDLERVNSERFGFKSTFDDGSMSEYMDDIDKRDMVEYRDRERRAEQAAKEIEKEASHKVHDRVDSGVSEEELFSSVKRPVLQNHPGDGVQSHPPNRSHLSPRGRGRPRAAPPRFQHLKEKEREYQCQAEQHQNQNMSNANRHHNTNSTPLVPPRRPDEDNSGSIAQPGRELYSSLVKRTLPARSHADYTIRPDISQGPFGQDPYQPMQHFPRRIVPIPSNAQIITQQQQQSQRSQILQQQQQQQPQQAQQQHHQKLQHHTLQQQPQLSPQQPQLSPQQQQLPPPPPPPPQQPPQQPQLPPPQQNQSHFPQSQQQQFHQIQQHQQQVLQPQFPHSQPPVQSQQLQFLQQPHQAQASHQQQQQQFLQQPQIQVSPQVSPQPQSSPKFQHSPPSHQPRSQSSNLQTSVQLPPPSPQQSPVVQREQVEFLQPSKTSIEKKNAEPEVVKQVGLDEQIKPVATVTKQKEDLFKNTKEVTVQKFGKVQPAQPRADELKPVPDIASLKAFGEDFKLPVKPEPKPQRRKERSRGPGEPRSPGESGRTLPLKVDEKEEEEVQLETLPKPEPEPLSISEKVEEINERLETIEKKAPVEEEAAPTDAPISPKEIKHEVQPDVIEERAPSPPVPEIAEQKEEVTERMFPSTPNNLPPRNSPPTRTSPPSRRSPKMYDTYHMERHASKLNPNAKEFVFNPNAREFTPQPSQKPHMPIMVQPVVLSGSPHIIATPGGIVSASVPQMTPPQGFTTVTHNTGANVTPRQQTFIRKRSGPPYAVQNVVESPVANPGPVFAHNPTFVQQTTSQGQVYYIAAQNVPYQGHPQAGQVITAITQQQGPHTQQVIRYVIPQASAGVTPQHVLTNSPYQEGNHPQVIYMSTNQGTAVMHQQTPPQVMHANQHGYSHHPAPSPQPHLQQQQQHYVVQQSPGPQYPQITSPHPATPQGTPGPHPGLHRPPTPSHQQLHSATPPHHAPQQTYVLAGPPVNGVIHSNFVGQPHGQGHVQSYQHAN